MTQTRLFQLAGQWIPYGLYNAVIDMQRNDGIEKGGTNDLVRSSAEDQQETPLLGNRATFTSIFDRHMCYPFFINLCEHFSIAEIVALTRTCKKYADLYQYLLPIQWNVDRKLRRFVRDPHGFRSQMAKSDALIVGSFVSQFFERTPWETSGLNIFVEGDERANSFQSYLLDEEGYTAIPSIRESSRVRRISNLYL